MSVQRRGGGDKRAPEKGGGVTGERVQTMSFCSGGSAAVNFAAP